MIFRPEKLKKFNCAGTIQDFAVAMLCDLDKPVMSVQNAASWGYFDCTEGAWNEKILQSAGFPVSLLPQVYKSGEIAGVLADNWHTIPKGTPIGKICNRYMYRVSHVHCPLEVSGKVS